MRASVTGEGTGTNLSPKEGEGFNPADENEKCPEKDGRNKRTDRGERDAEERVTAWRRR